MTVTVLPLTSDWPWVLPCPTGWGCSHVYDLQAGAWRASLSSPVFPLSLFHEMINDRARGSSFSQDPKLKGTEPELQSTSKENIRWGRNKPLFLKATEIGGAVCYCNTGNLSRLIKPTIHLLSSCLFYARFWGGPWDCNLKYYDYHGSYVLETLRV